MEPVCQLMAHRLILRLALPERLFPFFFSTTTPAIHGWVFALCRSPGSILTRVSPVPHQAVVVGLSAPVEQQVGANNISSLWKEVASVISWFTMPQPSFGKRCHDPGQWPKSEPAGSMLR